MGPAWMPLLAWRLLADLAPSPAVAPLPLSIAVAADESGAAVVDDAWLAAQTSVAQTLFAQSGVQFVRARVRPLDAQHSAAVETRADRDALAASAEPGVINVFVVASLRDVDDPARLRRGVHWHAPSGAHYLILARYAAPAVLAHELGHFFGNPHSPVLDNVMSYERSGGPLSFDEAQARRMAARARAYLSSGEIVGAPKQ